VVPRTITIVATQANHERSSQSGTRRDRGCAQASSELDDTVHTHGAKARELLHGSLARAVVGVEHGIRFVHVGGDRNDLLLEGPARNRRQRLGIGVEREGILRLTRNPCKQGQPAPEDSRTATQALGVSILGRSGCRPLGTATQCGSASVLVHSEGKAKQTAAPRRRPHRTWPPRSRR
jgi:hypothetical protein